MYKDISQYIVRTGITIRVAMKQLDASQNRVLFLVGESQKLIGSITDGDIRRWILSDGNLESDVKHVCHADPYSVCEGYDLESVKKKILVEKYAALPVIDGQGNIIDIIFWNELFEDLKLQREFRQLDIPIIIMAGGQGKRLEPFTKILPKPLIPIGDKTIIEIIIDKFLSYKVNHFYISINHKAKIIKSYFEELSPSYTIDFIQENMPLGTIGALAYLKGRIKESILITNCDIIIDTNYSDFLEFHRNSKYDISLVASLMHHKIPYGTCEIEAGGTLANFKEKPEFSFLASTGMYIINYDILELIPNDTLFHITDLIDLVSNRGGKVGVYPISEDSWLDTGEWHEYKKTLERFKV